MNRLTFAILTALLLASPMHAKDPAELTAAKKEFQIAAPGDEAARLRYANELGAILKPLMIAYRKTGDHTHTDELNSI